jgi:hypothetical protein
MTAARGYGAPRLGDSAVPVESEGAELDLGPRSAWVDVTASPQSCLRWRMRSAAPSHGAPPDTSDRRPVGAHGGTGRHKPAGSGTPPCPRRHLTVRLAQTVAGRGRTPRPRFRWRSDRDLQPGVDEAPTAARREQGCHRSRGRVGPVGPGGAVRPPVTSARASSVAVRISTRTRSTLERHTRQKRDQWRAGRCARSWLSESVLVTRST